MNRKTGINTSFLFISLTDNWKKAVKREIIFAEHVAWILTHFSARGKGRIRRPMVCWSVFFISSMISTCKQLQHTPRFHSVANDMALLQIFVKFGASENLGLYSKRNFLNAEFVKRAGKQERFHIKNALQLPQGSKIFLFGNLTHLTFRLELQCPNKTRYDLPWESPSSVKVF